MAKKLSQRRLDALALCDIVEELSREVARLGGNQIYAVGDELISDFLNRITKENQQNKKEGV